MSSMTTSQRNQANIPSEILRTIVTIDAVGSLSKAATELGLSQPTISMQLKRLNAIVGGAVFNKGGGSATVTPLGKLVVAQAKRFLNANDQILALGGGTAKNLPLRLGLPSLYARDFLQPGSGPTVKTSPLRPPTPPWWLPRLRKATWTLCV